MGTVDTETHLLDEFLPNWDFREQHSRLIAASSEQVRSALFAITAWDLPFSSLMLGLRLAPVALLARKRPPSLGRPVMDLFIELGFVELARTEHEMVLGTVGQFWRFREELLPLSSAEMFTQFGEPGFARGAINFRIEDEGRTALLSTETRVQATDDQARRSFRPYWVPVRAIGGLMRSEMLRAVSRRAKGTSRNSKT